MTKFVVCQVILTTFVVLFCKKGVVSVNFGHILKELRQERNLSQRDLAKQTGISQQALSLWEQNKRTPNMDDCIILADFYGISLDELVGRE